MNRKYIINLRLSMQTELSKKSPEIFRAFLIMLFVIPSCFQRCNTLKIFIDYLV
jgi:hypothetical protein